MLAAAQNRATRGNGMIGPLCGSAALLFTGCYGIPRAQARSLEYTVYGKTMPWLPEINTGADFGHEGGTSPVKINLSELGVSSGQSILIKYVSGTVSPNTDSFPYTDANGDQDWEIDDTDAGHGYAPSYYMPSTSYPIYLTELVGVFTDDSGTIVSTPFPVGDGPLVKTIPPNATQLQFGANDDYYKDNGGSWRIQVTPRPVTIFMNGVDVSDASSPTMVAVGQNISLTASPLPTGLLSQKWHISGTRFSGYSDACSGAACAPCLPGKDCPAPVSDDNSSVNFYWVNPDDPNDPNSFHGVSYTYSMPDGTTESVSAKFNVLGPSNPQESTNLNKPISISGDSFNINWIYFNASIEDPPGFPGTLKWVQTIEAQSLLLSNPILETCTSGVGLDNTFPYDNYDSVTGGTSTARDNPGVSLPGIKHSVYKPYLFDLTASAQFNATMYLMWQPNLPASVPIVVGFTKWGYIANAQRSASNQFWSGIVTPFASTFIPSPSGAYPQWKRVVKTLNGEKQACSVGTGQ